MARVQLEGVSKTFQGGVRALSGVDLIVESGERLVLLGPSGSGKSTLLRIVAGLDTPDCGTVRIGDRDVTNLPPHQRDISLAFQQVVLFPHWSVREELALGLRKRGWSAFLSSFWPVSLWSKSEATVNELAVTAANQLGIADLLERSPGALSGGERQRVALGRALVRKPAVFLFDEPLASVDPHRRFALRTWIAQQTDNGLTATIYVTHDREEALLLGDRVAVMSRGRVEQVGSPREVCESPASLTVAEFMHRGMLNTLPANALVRNLPEVNKTPLDQSRKNPAIAAIPPQAIELSRQVNQAAEGWSGTAQVASAKYVHLRQEIQLQNIRFERGENVSGRWTVSADAELSFQPKQFVSWRINPQRVLWFDDEGKLTIPFTLHGA